MPPSANHPPQRRPLPSYAQGQPLPAVAAMLLVSAWEPGGKDEEILQRLGSDRETVEEFCRAGLAAGVTRHEKLLRIPGNRSGQSWRWVDIRDTWKQLAPWIEEATWQRFEETCLAVLSGTELGSALLRKGLALTLALYGNSNGRVQLEPRPSIRASRVVEQLLTPPTQERWQALSEQLGLLAEAAPEVFLTSLEQSLTLNSAGVAGLWKAAPSVMQTLDRALALLALDVELLPRVMLILAQLTLTAGSAKANWRDAHPLHVLEEIFDPQWPKTNAAIEERLAALDLLRKELPEVAWGLFLKLLDQRGGMHELSVPRPRVMQLSVPALRRGVSGAAIYGQLATVLDWAVALAGVDSDKWAELIALYAHLPTDLRLTTLRSLEATCDQVPDDNQALWDALRSSLSVFSPKDTKAETSRAAGATNDRRSASAIEALQRKLYEQFQPRDFVAAHAWLFSDHPQLPVRYAALDEPLALLQQARDRFLAEVTNRPDRLALLESLARRVEDIPALARALAKSPWAPDLEQQFSTIQALPQRLAVWFLAFRIAQRAGPEIAGWFTRLVLSGQTLDVALLAQLLTGVSVDRDAQLWDLLDEAGGTARREYWESIGVSQVARPVPQASTERIISNLLWADRVTEAARAAIIIKEPASTELRLKALAAARAASRQGAVNPHSSPSPFCELLESLQPVTPSQIAQARQEEALWLPLLRRSNYRARWVPAWISENPAAFVELVRSGRQAEWLLKMWSGWPGDSLPPERGDQRLYEWALEVMRLLSESRPSNQPWVELTSVAVVLARPSGPDGPWPSIAVRRLLAEEEARGDSSLFQALTERRRDGSSMIVRSREGAMTRNQALALDCDQSAKQLAQNWPVAARLCETLADSYRQSIDSSQAASEQWKKLHKMTEEAVIPQPLFPLTELRIENFRGIEQATLSELHPHLNIIYGRNGSGKTSVMDALAVGLATLALKLPQDVTEEGSDLPTLRERDRHRPESGKPHPNIRLSLVGQSQAGEPLSWKAERNYVRGAESQDSESPELAAYIESLNQALTTRDPSVLLPVFAYYGVERAVSERAKQPETPSERERTRADGLVGALKGAAAFEQAAEWFRREWFLQLQAREENPSSVRPVLREVLQAVERSVVTPEGMGLKGLRVGKTLKLEVDLVRPGRKDFRMELGELSDGFRTALALSMDLARRMVECNPLPEGEQEHDGFGRQSRAVVLIDEVDEHLHPSWQKTVLHGLRRAFPQAQFFVSTHSPLVLSSEKDAKVWLMEDGKVSEVGQLYGNTSDTILRDYQDTLPRQDDIQELIKQARELVRLRKPDEAAVLIAKLEDLTEQPDLPELVGLRTGLTLLRHGSARPSVAGEKAPV